MTLTNRVNKLVLIDLSGFVMIDLMTWVIHMFLKQQSVMMNIMTQVLDKYVSLQQSHMMEIMTKVIDMVLSSSKS